LTPTVFEFALDLFVGVSGVTSSERA